MKLLVFVLVTLLSALPSISFAKIYWSTEMRIRAKGVTDCNSSRITSEAWSECRVWAEARSSSEVEYIIKDVKWSDGEIETEEGPAYDRWRRCYVTATIKCGYKKAIYE